jgi:putative transposase
LARAHRHYIPGHIWHITHRCHKREFLLKYAKDRHRWLQWLYKTRKRYGLVILNYTVTSNHIHLLVYDSAGQDVIPKSMQLVAGRTGQEYNKRKKRKGAFWEDRYHATIIEDGEHLLRCIVYNDMNMVRTGVVDHPEQWRHSGYNEIQSPRRKCILIDYNVLSRLAGFDDFVHFQNAHREWVNAALHQKTVLLRDTKWTQAIAVGGEAFLSTVKKQMRSLAIGRRVRPLQDGYELKEAMVPYSSHLEAKKGDIDPNNTWIWNLNAGITV